MRRTGTSDQQIIFQKQIASNDEFFRRFGREVDWTGKTVLDVGCGHGALSFRIATSGAAQVVGLDLDDYRIGFAREKAEQLEVENCEFICADVSTIGERFDVIVSKDTFEHVADLPAMLAVLRDRLEPEGELWAGFSPLYYSPNGHHRRTGTGNVPWAHCLPWFIVRRLTARRWGKRVVTPNDVGLNALTPAQFRDAVAEARLVVRTIEYNGGDRAGLRFLSWVRRVPGLEKYATVSIYAVLTAPS